MANKTSRKSAKVAKKTAAKRGTARLTLLSGGNPQIAKAGGDAPVPGATAGIVYPRQNARRVVSRISYS